MAQRRDRSVTRRRLQSLRDPALPGPSRRGKEGRATCVLTQRGKRRFRRLARAFARVGEPIALVFAPGASPPASLDPRTTSARPCRIGSTRRPQPGRAVAVIAIEEDDGLGTLCAREARKTSAAVAATRPDDHASPMPRGDFSRSVDRAAVDDEHFGDQRCGDAPAATRRVAVPASSNKPNPSSVADLDRSDDPRVPRATCLRSWLLPSSTLATTRPTPMPAGPVHACRPNSNGRLPQRAPLRRSTARTFSTRPIFIRGRARRSVLRRCMAMDRLRLSCVPGLRTGRRRARQYNGKFMCNQMVLRGASCATPRSHARLTYRNFFPPATRWQLTASDWQGERTSLHLPGGHNGHHRDAQ
jgi:hypothetical protein